MRVEVVVNGRPYERDVEPRLTLADFLRDELGLYGTHVGCEEGACGACTILLNGRSARSCLLFAVQADDAEVTTVEGLAPAPGELHPLQAAFRAHHGLQCGFCTPGALLAACELLAERKNVSDEEIRVALSGVLCRCTGYNGMVDAVRAADREWKR
jgi:carbon-monoxide dehydrogenase small subunit